MEKNKKPSKELKNFAKALLLTLDEMGISSAKDEYVNEADNALLRDLALATGLATHDEYRGYSALLLEYNNHQLAFYQRPDSVRFLVSASYHERGRVYTATSIRTAALVLLDKLPQVPRTGLTDREAAHVSIVVQQKQAGTVWDALATAAYRGKPADRKKLVEAYPKFFHKHLRKLAPAPG